MRCARLVAVAVVASAALGCGLGGEDLPPATERCDLGRDNIQGVAGHDLAAATPLPDGRVLFAFGDTYLGTVDGDEREVGGLLNQTGALVPAGEDICSDGLRYLTDGEGDVRELLPDPPRRGSAYWPVDVTVVGDTVWMLYRWVEASGDGDLDIRVLGTGLASANLDYFVFTPADELLVEGDEPVPSAILGQGDDLIALVCPDDGSSGDDGCRMRQLDTRTPALGDELAPPAIDLAATEMSLGRVEVDGEETWRVSSMPGLRCELEVATLVDDEWEQRTVLEPDPDGGGLCYAGRVQEPFSTDEELVVTWVENATERRNADAYWPHVVSIDLSEDEG